MGRYDSFTLLWRAIGGALAAATALSLAPDTPTAVPVIRQCLRCEHELADNTRVHGRGGRGPPMPYAPLRPGAAGVAMGKICRGCGPLYDVDGYMPPSLAKATKKELEEKDALKLYYT